MPYEINEEKNKECKLNKNNNKDNISEENKIESNQELKDNKDSIKNLLIDQIFYQKYSASNYKIINEIEIDPYGNYLYCCISFYL